MTRGVKKTWKLPKPPKGKKIEWFPVARLGKVVPWGYEQDPEDPLILNPIPEQLNKLELAKKHLKQYSYREVAQWLSAETGRIITARGLLERLNREQRNRREATSARFYAERLKEVLEKAEKLEKRLGGVQTYRVHDEDCSCKSCSSKN